MNVGNNFVINKELSIKSPDNSQKFKIRKSISNHKAFSPQFQKYQIKSNIKPNYSTEKESLLSNAGFNIILQNKSEKSKEFINQTRDIKLIKSAKNNDKTTSKLKIHLKENFETNSKYEYSLNLKQKSLNKEKEMTEKKEIIPEKSLKFLIDQETILSHINLFEIWTDIEHGIDNKLLFSNIITKYFKYFQSEFVSKHYIFEIFSSTIINRSYSKIIKLSLIILSLMKYLLSEFTSYDLGLKTQIRKHFNAVTDIIMNIFKYFMFDSLNQEIIDKKFGFIEKIKKTTKFSNKFDCTNLNLNEISSKIIQHINDNILVQVKEFAKTYFNYGFYQLIYNTANDALNQIDKIPIINFTHIVLETFLFNLLKKEENSKLISFHKFFYNQKNNGQPKHPYLPLFEKKGIKFTLVLDLDETLVHFFYTPSGGNFLIRPGCIEFLSELSKFYEIVIFTASMKEYADSIIDILDPLNTFISHRLYRQHVTLQDQGIIKDLTLMGRPIEKTIIVDNLTDNFSTLPNNGLTIKTWTGDILDSQLFDVKKILKDLIELNLEDVRILIKKINEIYEKQASLSNPYANIDIYKF